MKAVILAAGLGKRLRPYTEKLPKCLIKIEGKPILGRQIRALRDSGIKDITVVCGFMANKVREFAQSEGVKTIFNPFYARTNSVISLYLARPSADGDLLVINSDIILDSGLVHKVIHAPYAIAVLVNNQTKYGYRVRMKNNYVADMRMDLPLDSAFGVYGGVTKINRAKINHFYLMLEEWIENGRLGNWYEDVIVGMLKRGAKVRPVLTGNHLWHEIDTVKDLERARILLNKKETL